MEIRTLELFQHLAASLHFGRTSRACNITPSALSRAIQRLETEVGERLFVRDNRSVQLSRAGEVFRSYAEDVLQRWSILQDELSADSQLRGDLSLYCSVTAAYSILPDILRDFRSQNPLVHISLQTGDVARALTRLENHEADVTIAALPDRRSGRLRWLKITETPLVFICSASVAPWFEDEMDAEEERSDGNDRDAGDDGDDKRKRDWGRIPLILPELGLSRDRVDRWFASQGLEADIYARVAGNEAIIAMVSLGCGVGVVPRLVLERSPLREQVRIVERAPELEPFSIGLCTLEKNMANPRVAALWQTASQRASENRGIAAK